MRGHWDDGNEKELLAKAEQHYEQHKNCLRTSGSQRQAEHF
jgi:hypothetical protein